MAADLPAFLVRELQRIAEHGCTARRLIIVVDLPEPADGDNARAVDMTHHLSFADAMDDPGVLGAVVQFAVRGADA